MKALHLNTDFSKKMVINTASMPWVNSPKRGIFRKRLEAAETETNRATSIVKYTAGSSFSAHRHDQGEEILVLKGTFSDETGDYKAGTYLRNPPGSTHTPFSQDGCIIFVKLYQMSQADKNKVSINISQTPQSIGNHKGHTVSEIYKYSDITNTEKVMIEKLEANTSLKIPDNYGGYELLLLEGNLTIDGQMLSPLSWVRIPINSSALLSSAGGCSFWSKQGHLLLV